MSRFNRFLRWLDQPAGGFSIILAVLITAFILAVLNGFIL